MAGAKFPGLLDLGQPLVGRKREAEAILHQLDVAAAGVTRAVMLGGEPGIGKTRLLDWLAEQGAERGAVILRGGASQAAGMPPYLPILEALGQHVRATEPDVLRTQAGQGAPTLALILPELAAALGDIPPGYALPPEQARLRLFEAVGAFLAMIARSRPLVLLLDDLQWSDGSTLDLLCHVTRTQPHIHLLVVGAYRDDEAMDNAALQAAIAELAHQRRLTRLPVGPLSLVETAALTSQILGGGVNPRLASLLHDQCVGNPFFAEELLRGWLEVGALVEQVDGWALENLSSQELPPSVVAAVDQRLHRLQPEILEYLRVASVIGRSFLPSVLAAVVEDEPETVEDRLLPARLAGLIELDIHGAYRFRHDLIRECLHSQVTMTRRQRLHEAIGLALENQGAGSGDARLADLAFHFARSGDRERGIAYSRQAGHQAMRHSAIEAALGHYQTALGLLELNDERRGELLLEVAEASLLAGKETVAAASYEEAQALLVGSDRIGAAHAAHGLGLARRRQDASLEAYVAFEAALALLGEDSGPEAVRVLADLATLLSITMGRQEEGLARGQQALELARRLGGSRLEAAAGRTVGNLRVRANDIAHGLPLLEQALVLARADDDPAEAAECCACLANTYYWVADVERSRQYTILREDLAQRSQQPYELRHIYSWLAFLSATQGDWERAESFIARARPVAESLTSTEPLGFLHQIQGFLAWERGDFPGALRAFEAAAHIFREQSPGELAWYLGTLGLARLAAGKQRDAEDTLAELGHHLDALLPGSLQSAPALNCAMLLAVRMNDRARAARYYPQLRAFEGQLHWFLVDRTLAVYELMIGDWAEAERHLDQAEQAARRAGMRQVLAGILEDRADVGRKRPRSTLPSGLSLREVEVLRLVAAGMSNREIAGELHLSENTVAKHLTSIFNKTSSDNRAAAAAFATRHGLAQ